MLHLHPEAVLLLANFAYLCEAFFGVTPLVAVFRAFYSLRLVAEGQHSGCVDLQLGDEVARDMVPIRTMQEALGF